MAKSIAGSTLIQKLEKSKTVVILIATAAKKKMVGEKKTIVPEVARLTVVNATSEIGSTEQDPSSDLVP